MLDFSQFSGFVVFLAIFTTGFWLMLFLTLFAIPYWIVGYLREEWKYKKMENQSEAVIEE